MSERDELEIAKREAYSYYPRPDNMTYLGCEIRNGIQYMFYKCEDGTYWYDTHTKEQYDEMVRREKETRMKAKKMHRSECESFQCVE